MSPYWGKDFILFFVTLVGRLKLAFQGDLGWNELATDEIQVLVLVFIAGSSAIIGTFLVLRRMTMLANSLSHTILLGIIVTFLIVKQSGGAPQALDFKSLMIAALITAFLTTFVTEWLHKGLKLQEDASIGLVFTTFFALGIVGVTLFAKNAHLGVESIMGNVDALHLHDLKLAFFLFLLNSCLIFIFYSRYALITFDPILARNFGAFVLLFNHLLMLQAAATAIGAFRAVGVFLFLAFLVVPVLTARFFTKRLKPLLFCAFLVGGVASLVSVALSRHLLTEYQVAVSTAGLTTMVLGAFFLIGILSRGVISSARKSKVNHHERETDSPTGEHGLHRGEYPQSR